MGSTAPLGIHQEDSVMQPQLDEGDSPDTDTSAAAAPPDSGLRLAVGLLAILGLVAALYLARGFFVPLLIGILASYALHPLVDRLEAWRIPRSLGAALVLAM